MMRPRPPKKKLGFTLPGATLPGASLSPRALESTEPSTASADKLPLAESRCFQMSGYRMPPPEWDSEMWVLLEDREDMEITDDEDRELEEQDWWKRITDPVEKDTLKEAAIRMGWLKKWKWPYKIAYLILVDRNMRQALCDLAQQNPEFLILARTTLDLLGHKCENDRLPLSDRLLTELMNFNAAANLPLSYEENLIEKFKNLLSKLWSHHFCGHEELQDHAKVLLRWGENWHVQYALNSSGDSSTSNLTSASDKTNQSFTYSPGHSKEQPSEERDP